MNDFNWRLEEIRRRSRVLAKKRGRRKKVLVTVISAALCAAVCIPAILSDLNIFRTFRSRAEYVVDAVPVGQPEGSGENKGATPPLTDGGYTAGTLTPPESAIEPGNGTLENTKLTLSDLWGDRCTVTGENALRMIQILESLDYDLQKLCDCVERYRVRTESGVTYGIHLAEGYARCDKGQASLTGEQINIFGEIIKQAMGEDKQ